MSTLKKFQNVTELKKDKVRSSRNVIYVKTLDSTLSSMQKKGFSSFPHLNTNKCIYIILYDKL